MANDIVPLALGEIPFEETGSGTDTAASLLATVNIGGVLHHLEAIAVRRHRRHGQVAQDPVRETLLSDLYRAFEPDHPFHTVKIRNRDYVLFMSPFA